MFKIFRNGFSLAEMMIVMLILTLVLAAATPIITKRAVQKVATTGNASSDPAGSIIAFGGTNAPDGWLLCNGQAVSRTGTYANLFSAINTTYGIGDGSTTFNVPDLRGQFIRGLDTRTSLYNDPYYAETGNARTIGSSQSFQLEDHKHRIIDGVPIIQNMQIASGGGGFYAPCDGAVLSVDNVPNTAKPSTGNHGTETRPKNIALNYIIKY